MFAAPVWHYWIGVVLAVSVVAVMLTVFVQFLRKTQAPKYGRDE